MTGCHDDIGLVNACRAGQTEAFGDLVRKYQDRLYPTILRLAGSPDDAQDVLQDAFIRAFEKLEQFHGESSFYTWIYRIAVNVALSGHRKRQSHGGGGSLRPDRNGRIMEPADESAENDPSSVVERLEREAAIEAALAALGTDHRAVIILKDFDGRRYEEISDFLEIPVGTVRSRLHRARCELRDLLRSMGGRGAAGPARLARRGEGGGCMKVTSRPVLPHPPISPTRSTRNIGLITWREPCGNSSFTASRIRGSSIPTARLDPFLARRS